MSSVNTPWPVNITIEGSPEGYSVPAYSRGETWNDFEAPILTREAIESLRTDGGIGPQSGLSLYIEPTSSVLVMLGSSDGAPIFHDALNQAVEEVRSGLAAGKLPPEIQASGQMITIMTVPPAELSLPDGSVIQAWDTYGLGLAWFDADRPEDVTRPGM